jgi:hypothetical protein
VYGPSSRAQPFFTYPGERALGYFVEAFGVGTAYLMKGPPVICPAAPLGSKSFRDKKTAAAPAFLDYARLVVGVESEQDLHDQEQETCCEEDTEKSR